MTVYTIYQSCVQITTENLLASGVTSGLFTVKANPYEKCAGRSSLSLPTQEGAASVVTGSISFMVGREFLRALFYSIEAKREALSEWNRFLPGCFSQMENRAGKFPFDSPKIYYQLSLARDSYSRYLIKRCHSLDKYEHTNSSFLIMRFVVFFSS